MIENSVLPVSLKQADIKPIYKKDSRNENENYGPVSILPNLSKIYERYLYTQMNKSLILFLLNTNLDLERDIEHKNVYLL